MSRATTSACFSSQAGDPRSAPYAPGFAVDEGDSRVHEHKATVAIDAALPHLFAAARTSLPLALDALEAVLALLPEQGSADEDRPAGELGYLIERAIETALEES